MCEVFIKFNYVRRQNHHSTSIKSQYFHNVGFIVVVLVFFSYSGDIVSSEFDSANP